MSLLFFWLLSCTGLIGQAEPVEKKSFDFGHQLGHLYNNVDSAILLAKGYFRFAAGIYLLTESQLPGSGKQRRLVKIPTNFYFGLGEWVEGQIIYELLHDSTIQGPFRNSGGDLRLYTKIQLFNQLAGPFHHHLTLMVGMKLPNANDVNQDNHTFDFKQSSGLAGPGTDESDNILKILASQTWGDALRFTENIGLGIFGDPTRNGSQADVALWGLEIQRSNPDYHWGLRTQGFFGLLQTTTRDRYSIVQPFIKVVLDDLTLEIQGEKGLTDFSDDFGAAFFCSWQK